MEDNKKLIARTEKACKEASLKIEKALQERINEIQQVRRRLEAEARETQKKAEHTRATISQTRSQMQSLAEPIALCSTHSSWRKQRGAREQAPDGVEMRLEQQKCQLLDASDSLRKSREMEKGVLNDLQ